MSGSSHCHRIPTPAAHPGSFPAAPCLPADGRPVGLYLGGTDAASAGLGRLSMRLFISVTDGAAVPAGVTLLGTGRRLAAAAGTEACTALTLHLLLEGFLCHRSQQL